MIAIDAKHRSLSQFVILLLLLPLLTVSSNMVWGSGSDCATSFYPSASSPVITVENAAQVTQLAQLGLGSIEDITVSADGETLVVATSVNARVYRPLSSIPEVSILGPCSQWVTAVAISPDGAMIATAAKDTYAIDLWDSDTFQLVDSLETSKAHITSIAFNATGKWLAYAGSDPSENFLSNGNVFIHDLERGTQIAEFANVAEIVRGLNFTPNSEKIMFQGSQPGVLLQNFQIWDIQEEMRVDYKEAFGISPAYAHNTPVVALRIARGTEQMSEVFIDSIQLEMWNPLTNTFLNSFTDPNTSDFFAINSTGTLIATGATSGVIRLLDTETGAQTESFQAHSRVITDVVFSSDDRYILTVGFDDTEQSIRLWEVETLQLVLTVGGFTDRSGNPALAFSPVEPLLVIGDTIDFSGLLRLWNYETNTTQTRLEPETRRIYSVAVNPRGGQVAFGAEGNAEQNLTPTDVPRLWNPGTDTTIDLLGHTYSPDVLFSPDGSLLVSYSGQGRQARIWNTETGELMEILEYADWGPLDMAFSSDGNKLVSAGRDGAVRLMDIQTTEELKVFRHGESVNTVAFSSDGLMFASGSFSSVEPTDLLNFTSTIKLWNVMSGEEILTISDLEGIVRNVEFSPNGSLLAASTGEFIRLWDVTTGEELAVLTGHTDDVRDVEFNQDGTLLASVGYDGTVRLWGVAGE